MASGLRTVPCGQARRVQATLQPGWEGQDAQPAGALVLSPLNMSSSAPILGGVDRIMAPKDVPILISGTCEYDKRSFVVVIE